MTVRDDLARLDASVREAIRSERSLLADVKARVSAAEERLADAEACVETFTERWKGAVHDREAAEEQVRVLTEALERIDRLAEPPEFLYRIDHEAIRRIARAALRASISTEVQEEAR